MFEVRFHGRGGQGTVTAAELLSAAAFTDGQHAQAFPFRLGTHRRARDVVLPHRYRADQEPGAGHPAGRPRDPGPDAAASGERLRWRAARLPAADQLDPAGRGPEHREVHQRAAAWRGAHGPGNCFECDNCFGVCPDNAVIKLGAGLRYQIDLDYCKGCGMCASECPCGAISMVPEQT